MPSIDYFECSECGFRWKDQGPLLFCINEDNNIEEYILLSTTMNLDLNAEISGEIVETFCTNCDKKIKIYVISTVKKHYNKDTAKETLNALIQGNRIDKKTLKPFIRDTDMKDDLYIVDFYNNFHSTKEYKCPDCAYPIAKYILSKNKCPKCSGEIKAVEGMCLDNF